MNTDKEKKGTAVVVLSFSAGHTMDIEMKTKQDNEIFDRWMTRLVVAYVVGAALWLPLAGLWDLLETFAPR